MLVYICRAGNIADSQHQDLRVILDEACSNVMRHAYEDHRPGPLTLSLTLRHAAAANDAPRQPRARIELTLTDHGKAFNPLSRPAPNVSADLESRQPGGLGVHLIRKLSDEQFYCHSAATGNQLRIIKWLA